ncbi:hypothetical protein PVK06_008509 [Gossypium arboreum]|uniref:Uncharacterized protein n=1 Tax=Gossypium arboreum TaxID=29729 RepID=A0ABR0QKB4_GOSAR|nr:hypothetical protein PVK06_008509 [Gossypium arboreum]
MRFKEKEKARIGKKDSKPSSLIEKRSTKIIHDGGGRTQCKRKRIKGGNRENIDESPARLVRSKLVGNLSPCKVVAGD